MGRRTIYQSMQFKIAQYSQRMLSKAPGNRPDSALSEDLPSDKYAPMFPVYLKFSKKPLASDSIEVLLTNRTQITALWSDDIEPAVEMVEENSSTTDRRYISVYRSPEKDLADQG